MKRLALASLVVAAILYLDQLTKTLIVNNLPVGETIFPILALSGVFALSHVTNTGIAFGLFKDANTFFIIVSIGVALLLVNVLRRLPREEWLLHAALSLVLGGALGNLIDRVRLGYVIDFVALGPLPRFNVADIAIFVGVILLGLRMLLQDRRAASPHAPDVN